MHTGTLLSQEQLSGLRITVFSVFLFFCIFAGNMYFQTALQRGGRDPPHHQSRTQAPSFPARPDGVTFVMFA